MHSLIQRHTTLLILALFVGSLSLSGCASLSNTEKGAAAGAAGGAVVGGVIGNAAGSTAKGAIIGAVLGGALPGEAAPLLAVVALPRLAGARAPSTTGRCAATPTPTSACMP